jgi:hypothetical protein
VVPADAGKVEIAFARNISTRVLLTGLIYPGNKSEIEEPVMDTVAYIAFEADRCIAAGGLRDVVTAAKAVLDRRMDASILVFNGNTSAPVDIDFRGSIGEVLARLPALAGTPEATEDMALPTPRGPGRPKLGVVAREVTLLPRHWEWLARQSGGASVALRKLVDEARRNGEGGDRIRHGQEAAYRFMSAMAGNKANYEDAIRALFAGDAARFENLIAGWPADVRSHASRLAKPAFDREPAARAG